MKKLAYLILVSIPILFVLSIWYKFGGSIEKNENTMKFTKKENESFQGSGSTSTW
jgi:hypothetical protein